MKCLNLVLAFVYGLQATLSHAALGADKKLELLLEVAQGHFFSGSPIEQTQKAFEQITNSVHLLDPSAEVQELFFFAHLRRAQLSLNQEDQQKWLNKAIVFDWSKAPDPNLFSPELIDSFNSEKSKVKYHSLSCDERQVDRANLFVNGRKLQCLKGSFKHPVSPHLVWGVESPSNAIIKAASMPAEFKEKMNGHKTSLSDLNKNAKTEWQTEGPNQIGLQQLHPEISVDDTSQTSAQLRTEVVQSFETKTKVDKPSFFKNKWVWIGLGVLTTGLVISQTQRSSSQPTQPSTREGL